MNPIVLEMVKQDPIKNLWTCHSCIKKEERSTALKEVIVAEEEVVEESGKERTEVRTSLRILQWNAEAFAGKLFELTQRLQEDEIDVCLIQESRLKENHQTPYIKGYKTIRSDRVGAFGGGLLSFVKKSLVVEETGKSAIEANEISSFRITLGKKKWINLANVYIPPSSSTAQTCELRLDTIPTLKSSIICGDFNAHSALWDNNYPTDDREEALVDWIFDKTCQSSTTEKQHECTAPLAH